MAHSLSLRRVVVLLLGALIATLSFSAIPASAATTVSPSESGPLVRDDAVTLSVDTGALNYTRLTATGSFAAQSATATALGAGCRGDIPGGVDNSARTIVTVKDPGGTTILTATSLVRNLGLAGFGTTPKNQPLSPQPAPATANYRGDFPDAAAFHGMTASLSLTGKPAGIYTITTTNNNTVKTGSGACAIGKPSATDAKIAVPGPEVATSTFEYRPWQYNFKDILGKGKVSLNAAPGEYTYSIGAKTAPIFAAGPDNKMSFYALPDGTGYALPSDPEACAADPSSCLPVSASPCNPSAGCTPRLAIVNRPANAGKQLAGVFDLETRAFIAYAVIDGTKRVLTSLGTENDPIYHDLIDKLSTGAAAQGIDLPTILGTEVRVNGGDGQQTSLSLLNGLQVDPSSAHGGVQIASNATAQAGIILHVYSSLRLTGDPSCAANSASSTGDPNRYTRTQTDGYNVTKSDVVPKVPEVGALGAIVGGPLYHITGSFKSDALLNTASAVVGLDTAVDEPKGYPVWIEPFVSSPTHVAKPAKMDFLGTGTWSAAESPVGTTGCLVVDFLLGTGVALFNNPLPVGLGTIFDPLAKPTPAAEQLTDKVSEVLDQVSGQATSNPTVAALLDQLTAALPLG